MSVGSFGISSRFWIDQSGYFTKFEKNVGQMFYNFKSLNDESKQWRNTQQRHRRNQGEERFECKKEEKVKWRLVLFYYKFIRVKLTFPNLGVQQKKK